MVVDYVDGNRLARELLGHDEVELAERSLWEFYTDPEAGRDVLGPGIGRGGDEQCHTRNSLFAVPAPFWQPSI